MGLTDNGVAGFEDFGDAAAIDGAAFNADLARFAVPAGAIDSNAASSASVAGMTRAFLRLSGAIELAV